MKKFLLVFSLFFLALSFVSGLIQKIFYPQYIDAQGVLHETLLTPIAAFSFVLSIIGFLLWLMLLLFQLIRRWIK
ncbi:DUF3955 domain-containing protein [Candidatus Thiodubiliella endoseptemdiera]|uniref:DUF3955 domain-containing protein n=1 Tax=Candidatus Thiodubiliella endoseptemdiera TaxID=2738886 RepID=A0A853F120_9GAMM|nr:DUF3955 domain-containing protein [Candidatus Thiodubiliella endoseptemdiera]